MTLLQRATAFLPTIQEEKRKAELEKIEREVASRLKIFKAFEHDFPGLLDELAAAGIDVVFEEDFYENPQLSISNEEAEINVNQSITNEKEPCWSFDHVYEVVVTGRSDATDRMTYYIASGLGLIDA